MPDKHLTINVLSPEGEVFSGDAASIFLPGRQFPFQVLPGHAPIISTLGAGNIRIVSADGSENVLKIKSGAAKVKNDMVTICVEL